MAWQEIPLKNKILQNVAESALGILNAATENCYITDAGGLARFPLLTTYKVLKGSDPVYLDEWRGDLIAVTGGTVFRVDTTNNTADDITGAAVQGGKRVTFAQTENELLMAAGKKIVKLAGARTEILSDQAPESTHVGFVSGYVVANEPRSGRFYHSTAGVYDQWDSLDTFAAEGNPDNITSLLVSEFGELLLAGEKSIEQFDAAPSGQRPFFRRWMLGTGLYAPYTFLSVNNQLWGLNTKREWTAFSAQVGNIASQDIQNTLEDVDDWTDGWATEVTINGQRFMIVQAPYATNPYGTQGVTLLFDYRKQRWGNLYGWDSQKSLPARWPGWSYKRIGRRQFVGGNGVIYEINGFSGESVQRVLWRSGHISRPGNQPFRIEGVSVRLERGSAAQGATVPQISLRVNKNNNGFGRLVRGSLGAAGNRNMTLDFPAMGICDSAQFEIQFTDNGALEIARMDMDITPLKR